MIAGVDVEPSAIRVDGLAPGDTAARPVVVRNDSGVPVVVRAQHADDGDLLSGTAPLAVTYRWDGAAGWCAGDPVVDAGREVELTLVVTMPADAGDEYQGAVGSSVLTLGATQHVGCGAGGGALAAPPGGAGLALTGAQGGTLLLAVAVLTGTWVALTRARRRRRATG
ncbi:hypothetical protein [Cellulomonas sp. Y8]|uniref:hypothetical protein n=1 Tax=Cellulomonas sp. Y8 TaxID=2591145 RepID=UPI003D710873